MGEVIIACICARYSQESIREESLCIVKATYAPLVVFEAAAEF